MYTHAGPEIGVASTKPFTSQLVALHLVAAYLGQIRGTLSPDVARPHLERDHAASAPPRTDAEVRTGDGRDREALLSAQRFPVSRARNQLSRSRSKAR